MNCAEWEIQWACNVDAEDPDKLDNVRLAAQELLWAMSGRRYGLCTVTEGYRLPCTSPCYVPWADDFGPGVEYRLGFDQRRRCCAITLHQQPVRGIVDVTVFGDVLSPDDYYLGRGILYRIGECFPCDDECDVPPVQVTYSYGIDPPVLAKLALGELACEMLRALDGADCRLPSNAISVTRQGVTVDLGDLQTLFEQNRLGLPICDEFLRMTNPDKLRQRSQVFSPDTARRVR
jgi:hypothetical protein